MTNEAKIHSGGFPVGPDIKALNEEFPELRAGMVIEYDHIGAVIGCSWREPRWWRVVDAWRESLEPRGFLTKCDPGKALVVLTDHLAIGHIYDETGVAKRKIRKTAKRASYIRPKDENTRRLADHQRSMLAKILQVVEIGHKRMVVPKREVLPSAATSD